MEYLKACIGISPVYNLNLSEIRSLIETSGSTQPTCVVFTLGDGKNSLLKLLRILYTFVKIRVISIFFSKKNRLITSAYGIYPTTLEPLVIFELQSPAEEYTVQNILPKGPRGLNGYLRLIITRLTKINPVLGGVALVIREHT